MKVVLLAGGMGTRLAEETEVRPKPMVEIGGRPLLWHIMKLYAHHGFAEFVVALGYKGDYIKRYFADFSVTSGNLTVDMKRGEVRRWDGDEHEAWTVHLVDTGVETLTGGRVLRLKAQLEQERFLLTYGDGVSNIDLKALLAFHERMGRVATVTAVRPPARFGGLEFEGDLVARFTEKPQVGEGWINGGFLVLEPAVFDYIDGDQTSLESHVLERLAAEGQLAAYRHYQFWQCVDTVRDKRVLEQFWDSGRPPWRVWS